MSTLKKIFDNIIQYPNDDKHWQIELKDDTFSNTVWQYSAGKELMKMSGWVLEDDHVKLRDDSCVQILSQSLKSFLSSSATGVVPLLDDEFQVLINAFYNGDIPCIQKLLKASHISPNGRIYSESGSSLNLFYSATIAQQIDIIKLLMTDYSILFMYNDLVLSFFSCIFSYARQSFIVAVLRYYGIIIGSEFIEIGTSLLHFAVYTNCFDVICFLLKECGNIDVNATDDSLRTPLHYAYLAGHTQIAQYLIQHGADVLAVDTDGCTPCEYIDGDPNWIMDLEYLQNKRKIHHVAFSIEHCYYMNLVNLGIDEEEVVSLTMEQFPSLKERPTQPHHDIIDHATALKEFTQYITN